MSTFLDLGVPARLSSLLADHGIETPTPIQAATLPDALAGRDVLGRGRTGSGKTYAFLLPLVARLTGGRPARPKAPRALILAPTRELVGQIEASLAPLADAAGLRVRTVFGGVGQGPQVAALRRGVDVVIACPGRLEDLIQQGHCDLGDAAITVLDEADHMADLGFLPGVRRLLARTPERAQRLLFSATLDNAVDALVRQFLHDPITHEADGLATPAAAMDHHVLHIDREQRLPILLELTCGPERTVVFTRTKYGAKGLAAQLNRRGVAAVDLHGNLSQGARTRNLDAFHTGKVSVLVATDIAARGIHVDDVTLVVHSDPPAEAKAYLHRSGRTARAGNAGTVVTLATGDQLATVRSLTKQAGIRPTTTRITEASDPLLGELAPGGQRSLAPREQPGRPDQPARSEVDRPARSRRRSRSGKPRQAGQSSTGRPSPGRQARDTTASQGGAQRRSREQATGSGARRAQSAARRRRSNGAARERDRDTTRTIG